MPTNPEFIRRKYGELALVLLLIDSLVQDEAEAREAGITVDQLMDRRWKEKLNRDGQHAPAGKQSIRTP
jgi:hypothetical protein